MTDWAELGPSQQYPVAVPPGTSTLECTLEVSGLGNFERTVTAFFKKNERDNPEYYSFTITLTGNTIAPR